MNLPASIEAKGDTTDFASIHACVSYGMGVETDLSDAGGR